MKKKHLGAILVEQGAISEETIKKALAFQKRKKDEGRSVTLGEILLHNGKISRKQLDKALQTQKMQNQANAVIKSKTELELDHGRLYLKQTDAQGNRLVDQSSSKHILVVENDSGDPFILHTEQGKKSHINAFLKTQEKLEKAYQDKSIKPTHVLVSANLIEIMAAQGKNDGSEEDQTDLENRFEKILREGFEAGASDVHFFRYEDNCLVRFRIYGNIRTYDEMPAQMADDLISVGFSSFGSGGSNVYWKKEVKQRIRMRFTYSEHITVAGRYEHSPGDDGQYHACIRLMPDDRRERTKEIDFLKLGFTKAQTRTLKGGASKASGLVCFSGPTGSGKSTTMAGLVKWLNKDDDTVILTVESPIERPLPAFQTSVSDDDDADPKEFADAIKSTLRRDPDALMVGEIRDSYSSEAAVSGVQTGHMLLTSIHAQSAIEIVERMSSSALKIPTQTIGSPSFISVLVFQMLLPKLDEQSRIRVTSQNIHDLLSEEEAERVLAVVPNLDAANICIRGSRPEYPEGISGMTICAEVLNPDQIMRTHFQRLELNEALKRWKELGEKDRGKPLDERCAGFNSLDHAYEKMKLGLIDPRDVEAYFGLLSPDEIDVQGSAPGMFEGEVHDASTGLQSGAVTRLERQPLTEELP
jgi:type II secretory ATPase GspE/PulE/Tfp pilus assembly ATPase PilB-like protein